MVKSNREKFTLLVLGEEESLRMMFVGGELEEKGYEFKYFDGEYEDVVDRIVRYNPSHICFSPLATNERRMLKICESVKKKIPQAVPDFCFTELKQGLQKTYEALAVEAK